MKTNWLYIVLAGLAAYLYYHKSAVATAPSSAVATAPSSSVSNPASTMPILTSDLSNITNPVTVTDADTVKVQNLVDAIGPWNYGSGADLVVSGVGQDMAKMPFECLSYIGMNSPYPECNTIDPGYGEPFGHGSDLAY